MSCLDFAEGEHLRVVGHDGADAFILLHQYFCARGEEGRAIQIVPESYAYIDTLSKQVWFNANVCCLHMQLHFHIE